jgi:ABC-type polysaccharide/polyol phosphate export permease
MNNFVSDVTSLVEINLKVRYRQTIIGFLWVLSNPILLYFVQAILFGQLLRGFSDNYYFYLFSGLLPWFYISQTAEMGCNLINSHSRLIRNVRVHPFKIICALAAENFINFVCASLIIFCVLFFMFDLRLGLLIQYLITSLYLIPLVAEITFIASVLNCLVKDTRYVLHFVFTVLYFMTPSFYNPASLPPVAQSILKLNPFYWVISLFRLTGESPDLMTVVGLNLAFVSILGVASIGLWKALKAQVYLKI